MTDRMPCTFKLLRALGGSQHTHVVWVIYSWLLAEAKRGVVDLTTDELAKKAGLGRTVTKHALKVLRQLQLVEGPFAVGEGWQVRVHRDGTLLTHMLCEQIAAGEASVDMQSGVVEVSVAEEPQELELHLASSGHSNDQSEASSIVFLSNTSSNTKTSITSDGLESGGMVREDRRALRDELPPPLPAAELDPPKRKGRNGKRYVPLTDEHRETIERIQAHANALFKTSHGLLNTAGQEIGKSTGVSGRYGVIRRALVEWGFTEEQLKGALHMAAKDPWWAERKINDTVNLLRKLQHVQKWVDLWSSGQEHPRTGKWDKKQTDLGASKVLGENGKVDQSKVTTEFV